MCSGYPAVPARHAADDGGAAECLSCAEAELRGGRDAGEARWAGSTQARQRKLPGRV